MNDANNGSKLYLYSITTVAILGGLLFGYDTAVISGAEKGLEAFFLMATDFQYDKVMHGITSSSALIGCVIGGALSGFFASRLGRRNSLRLASVLFFLSALGSYYPEFLFFNYGEPNMELLIAFNLYRVLGGIGVGLASAVCPMYIAEIAPSNIRGTLVSCNQFAIIFGMLVVYFVNFLIMGDHTNPIIDKSAEGILSVNAASDMWSVQTGWRYMFGSEAFPAALFGFLLFFVPKTPRYLVLVHQDEKAYSILEKVNGANKAKEILAEIKATSKEKTEKLFSYGVAVIVIGILLSVFQQAIGINAVLYYAPRIFENAGAEGGGMMQTVIMGIVNIVFTLVAIFTVDRFGRKPFYRYGSRCICSGNVRQHGYQGHRSGTFRNCICSILHDVVGTDLLGIDCRNLPEYYPWQSRSYCSSFPMDFQLYHILYIPGTVRLQSDVRIQFVWHHLCCSCLLRLALGTRNEG